MACNKKCDKLTFYVQEYMRLTDVLGVFLPDNFDDYWSRVKGPARTDWRKAKHRGYTLERICDIRPIEKEVFEIFHSKKYRQGRPVRYGRSKTEITYDKNGIVNIGKFYKNYYEEKWEPQTFYFKCPDHREDFWIVRNKQGKIVACMNTVIANKYVITKVVMGHAKYLGDGIMKFLFLGVIWQYIKEGMEIFMYGFDSFFKDSRKYFNEDLLITTNMSRYFWGITNGKD